GNDAEIVHAADVVLESALFFDVVVKAIQHQKSKELAGLVSQRQAVRLVDIDHQEVIDAHIQTALLKDAAQLCLDDIVVNRREEVVDVAFEHPAVGCAVLGIVPDKGTVSAG